MQIAIIGATSHVAKNIIYQNKLARNFTITCFARNTDKVRVFLNDIDALDIPTFELATFDVGSTMVFDAIINCVGFGTPQKVVAAGVDLFTISETIDNMIIENIQKNPNTLYINFSSGAVYGSAFETPQVPGRESAIQLSPIEENQFYRISKIYSEAKHRVLSNNYIVDIRLFSIFSRFIDMDGAYLLTDIVKALMSKTIFKTSNSNIFRDFLSPEDLYTLIVKLIEKKNLNCSIDTYSKSHVSKNEIIEYFVNNYNVQVEYTDSAMLSPTGRKIHIDVCDLEVCKLINTLVNCCVAME